MRDFCRGIVIFYCTLIIAGGWSIRGNSKRQVQLFETSWQSVAIVAGVSLFHLLSFTLLKRRGPLDLTIVYWSTEQFRFAGGEMLALLASIFFFTRAVKLGTCVWIPAVAIVFFLARMTYHCVWPLPIWYLWRFIADFVSVPIYKLRPWFSLVPLLALAFLLVARPRKVSISSDLLRFLAPAAWCLINFTLIGH